MRNIKTKGYLIGVDIDGILAEGDFWGSGDPKPIQENIDLLQQLIYSGHHIILYTSRKEWWRPQTEEWLLKNQVPYHALVMSKCPCDIYLDDKAFNNAKDLRQFLDN